MKRRVYPEVSFSWIGCLAEGLMGIRPNASTRTLNTCPRLTAQTPDAALRGIPLFDGEVHLQHRGLRSSRLDNHTGGPLNWNAAFPGMHEVLYVDGKEVRANTYMDNDKPYSAVMVCVNQGSARIIEVR
ncbi:hypothetical protein [Paenibacillus mendelii]|uniref:Uncharacterized protein n=1 Tax=Paenibacillus mendelii TaxID=206163 RepID=A0ABV6J865_9BACL|nr:hypothetical protein [Paenibacillus mendelii]MCQ6560979.1 hypothetical protein [Paenibacillus mendelii]